MTKVAIGWPDSGSVRGEFTRDLLALVRFELEQPGPYKVIGPERVGGPYLPPNRNSLVEWARREGADWLFHMECDHSFDPRLLRMMMETANPTRPIVVGIYALPMQLEDGVSVELCDSIYAENKYGSYTTMVAPSDFHPFRVDASGLGAVLVHMSVFERMEYPWFWLEHIQVHTHASPHKLQMQVMSDDFSFFRKARAMGHDIWCDPRAELVHLKTLPLTASAMRRFIQRAQKAKADMVRAA